MSIIRGFAKWFVVLVLGRESSPHRILRGLASGYRICLSPAENLGYLLGTAEPHLQRIIRKYVSPGQIVYDIGANIGYVTLSLAKRVGPHGRVFAFEPIPKNIEFLRHTLEANRLTTVKLLEAAASNTSGDAVIRMTENLSTPSLVWHRKNPASRELIIKTVVIDHLVEAGEIPRPSFVKIDVEGAEGLVLQGMRNTILAANPVLFIECSEIGRQISWDLLRESGYRCQSAITCQWIDTFADTNIPIFCGCRQSTQPDLCASVRGVRCAKNGPRQTTISAANSLARPCCRPDFQYAPPAPPQPRFLPVHSVPFGS